MKKLPIILDDIIGEELQNQIENLMFDCLWRFEMDNTFSYNQIQKSMKVKCRKFLNPFEYDISPAFTTNIAINPKIYNKVVSLIKKGCNEINFNVEKVDRCFGSIHALIKNKQKPDNIHINQETPHLVMLYYVNDADGDTILYDKTASDILDDKMYIDEECEFNIVNKISPKRGRILFFDGRTYHASSTPTKSIRCIISLDLFGEFVEGSYKFPAPKKDVKRSNRSNFLYQ
jgi:hypothetical protein